MRRLNGVRTFLALIAAACAVPVAAQPAPDDHSVLILSSTVDGGAASVEAIQATLLGLTPVVVTGAQWGAMSQLDFASYRALILGDPDCVADPAPLAAAEANSAVWGPAVDGNVLILGSDPVWHGRRNAPGGITVTSQAIGFAADEPLKTGLYASLSCYYHNSAAGTPVAALDALGSFTVQGVGCFDDVHIVASHPALAGLTDADLSGWDCSVHEAFDSFPPDFLVLVIAEAASGDGVLSFPDGSSGIPYVLARGETVSPLRCGDGDLDPDFEQCDDGNNANGDGCSAQCMLEGCGNGLPDPGEECDDGNNADGDGCTAGCQLEECGNDVLDAGEQCDDGNNTDGDGCSASCILEVACEPDARNHGYYHRQCMAVPQAEGGIDPGRNGRGPAEPLEGAFIKTSMAAVAVELENRLFETGGACQGGILLNPTGDKCEQAVREFTTLLFNRATGRIQDSCIADLENFGCSSTAIGPLLGELAGLINSGDDQMCHRADKCAERINSGEAWVESRPAGATPATTAARLTGGALPTVETAMTPTPEPPAEPARQPAVPHALVMEFSAPAPSSEPERGPEPEPERDAAEDPVEALRRQLAVVGSPLAPEDARGVALDALLDALSGGFDPEVRLEILRGLLGTVDAAYDTLLREHALDVESECRAFGKEDLARQAARLAAQLEAAN